jgi:hypothetical protein
MGPAACMARLASFCEGEASFGIARPYHNVQPSVGMCANKIIPQYDLIGHLIGKRMILLGRTQGGP